MEAAFDSGDGDEVATAQVAQVAAEATGGTIFHQIYTPWRGELNSRWVRNWAIFRYHIYGLFSKGHKPWPMITKLTIFGVLLLSISDLIMLAVGAASGTEAIERLSGISRGNLYGHVLSFWFRNACTYPIVTALIIGGMISEDRRNGTSALYFSRPINRRDYAAMKYISVAAILTIIVLFTLSAYYLGAILVGGEGWSYVMDTGLLFLGAFIAGTLLVITYTSIGLCLSSVSSGKFFPAVAFIGLILGSKLVAFLIWALFDSSAIYLISPYDCLAHVGQWMLGLNHTYEHPASWSLVMLIAMNAVSLYIISMRVSSLEVTRE
jgi:ABC-2 type transport system permease protein